ncbi:hypothetical protein [Spirosoma litoris]
MATLRATGIHFTLEIPIYSQDALFILGYSRSRAADLIEKHGGSVELVDYIRNLKQCKGVATQDGESGRFLIYMEDLPRKSTEHGSLVHELFHLTEQIMERVGMRHKIRYSSEAYAYLIGQLTAEVLGRLWTATNI